MVLLLSVGMAATLALLKGTGELGKKEELAGRTKDQRSSDPSSLGGILCTSHPVNKHTFLPLSNAPNFNTSPQTFLINSNTYWTDSSVKLEYRDEFGRKLTQKEAFRQLCYKFHGYGPGHPLSPFPFFPVNYV